MYKYLKYLTPPIFVILYKNFFLKINKKAIWSGNYSSWEEAQINCTGYDSVTILEKCKEALSKVKNGEAVYERDSVLFDEIQYSWGLLAGLQKVAIENEGKLCVLDFGGSLGSTYFQHKVFLSGIEKIEWNIVEQAHFVDCGKENFENNELKFYHTIGECLLKHNPTVLVLSSVLQYLSNVEECLEQFNNSNFAYILIDRNTSIPSEQNILTIQNVPESIYKASYPCWFFNHQFIQNKLTNYTLISSFNGAYEPINYRLNDNVIANWKGYIFKKK